MVTMSTTSDRVTGLAVGARYVLLALAAVFAAGAIGQFFLVGLSTFESASHWTDHANLGHMLGLIAYVIWIPALVGRVGGRLIAGSIALALLFGLQYAFIESSETTLQALHPLNGAVLFALSLWIGLSAFGQIRGVTRSRDDRRQMA